MITGVVNARCLDRFSVPILPGPLCVLEPADAVLAVCVVWVDGGAVCVAAAVLSVDAGLAVAEVVLGGAGVG